MRHYVMCIDCHESDPTCIVWSAGELTNHLCALCTCPRGHKTVSSLMHHVPDVLYLSAVRAFKSGCYSESVLSFTAAFERTCELFFKAFSLKHGLTLEQTGSMWKELKNQSERQYGAFCLAYCITTHRPWRTDTKMVEFRNSVVHKGYIATKSETEVYAQYVTENLDRVIDCLNAHFDKECREIYFHTKKSIRPSIEKIMKANPGSKFSATGQPSLLRWNHPNRESMSFSDVIKRSDELDTKFPH